MNLRETGWEVDGICLAHDDDKCRAFVNAIVNVRFP